MRPRQWIKNFMIFPAMVFAGQFFDLESLVLTAMGFVVFCCVSGAVYLFNDIQDVEKDREHPKKRFRPIPSGDLPVAVAMRGAGIIMVLSLGGSLAMNLVSSKVGFDFFGICVAYLLLQVAYSKVLKHVVILDVGVIATGFVLRVLAGGAILNLMVSPWIIICTTLLALFLGFGKRRHEIVLLEDDAGTHRKILKEYSPYYLDQMIAVVTASTVVAYSLYTLDPTTIERLGTSRLPITIPFVIYGIFRYLYLVHQKEEGGSPSRILLTDKPLLIDIALYFVTVVVLLYLK
jgi:4-hydroxybenzoate polyprenyltransferase